MNNDQANHTVYLRNLLFSINEKELFGLFRKFGKVKHIKLVKIPGSEKSKGMAFISMKEAKGAKEAIAYFDGREVGGRTLKATMARDLPAKKSSSDRSEKREKEEGPRRKVKRSERRGGLKELFAYQKQKR